MHQIRKITIKMLKYFELDHNENTTDQNFVDAVEALLKGKFMARTCTFKNRSLKSSKLSTHLKTLEAAAVATNTNIH